MEQQKIGPVLALLADVEALKIAISAIVKFLPDDLLDDIRAFAEAHCEHEQEQLQATLATDAQIDRVRSTLEQLLLGAQQKPEPTA